MSEPVLKLKPVSYGRRNYLRDVPPLIILGVLWYFVGIVLPPKVQRTNMGIRLNTIILHPHGWASHMGRGPSGKEQ